MTETRRHRVPVDRVRLRRHLSWPTAPAEVLRSDEGRPLGLIVPTAHPEWHRIARILKAVTADEIDRIEQARWYLRDEYHTTHHAAGRAARLGVEHDLVWAAYCRWVADQDIAVSEAMTRDELFAAIAALGYRTTGPRVQGLVEKIDLGAI